MPTAPKMVYVRTPTGAFLMKTSAIGTAAGVGTAMLSGLFNAGEALGGPVAHPFLPLALAGTAVGAYGLNKWSRSQLKQIPLSEAKAKHLYFFRTPKEAD